MCLPSKLSDHSTELQAKGGGDHLIAVRADGHHDVVPLAIHLYLPVLNLVQLAFSVEICVLYFRFCDLSFYIFQTECIILLPCIGNRATI